MQTLEEMRAQTANLPQNAHTMSTVTINLPADFSFLQTPRGADAKGDGRADMDSGGDGGRDAKEGSFGTFWSAVGGYRDSDVNRHRRDSGDNEGKFGNCFLCGWFLSDGCAAGG